MRIYWKSTKSDGAYERADGSLPQNSAAHRTALQSLLAMNGNMPLEFAETTYPAIQEINDYNVMRDEVMASDLDLQAAAATARAAEKQVSVDRQGWLPKLEAGFRRNTDDAVSMNGFVVRGLLAFVSES